MTPQRKQIIKTILIALLMLTIFVVGIGLVGANRTREYDCSDFHSREEAEKLFRQNREDIFQLDRDNDGIPCESLPTIKYY